MRRIMSFILLFSVLAMFTSANAAVDQNTHPSNTVSLNNETTNERVHSCKSTGISPAIFDKLDGMLDHQHGLLKETVDTDATPTFNLPASLQIIEDEAFEGTAIVAVDLPETVETIGERAFANIPTLRQITIPQKTKRIAKTAFAGSKNVILTGAYGSFAHAWARENCIPFAPAAVITANARTVRVSVVYRRSKDCLGHIIANPDDGNGIGPSQYCFFETVGHQCLEGIAYHIQGRSPPAFAWIA